MFFPESWFVTTAAAQGLRDARRDYPREDTFIEVASLVQPTPNSTRFAVETEGIHSGKLKLAPYEFEELKIAESRIDHICEGAEKARQRFEARMSQVHYRMQDLLREALKNRAAHSQKHFSHPHALMPGWLYILVMTVMGAAELLFNATAFRLIESGQDYQSYIMAVAPTLSLLMMAHFLGVRWRQWSPSTLGRNLMIALGIFVTITIASYALGIMRAEFVEVKGAEAAARAAADALQNAQDERASLERQVEELRAATRSGRDRISASAALEQLGLAEKALAQSMAEEKDLAQKAVAAKQSLSESRRGLVTPNLRHVWMLFAINMLILMTGAFASYYTHDGDPELERIVKQKARLRRELHRWWNRWGAASERYDRIIKTAREQINRVIHEFEAVVGEYRWYNTRNRSGYPSFFREDFAGRTFLTRSFGHETELAPANLRETFADIQKELLADDALLKPIPEAANAA